MGHMGKSLPARSLSLHRLVPDNDTLETQQVQSDNRSCAVRLTWLTRPLD